MLHILPSTKPRQAPIRFALRERSQKTVFHSFHRLAPPSLETAPAAAYHGLSLSAPEQIANFMAHPIPIHAGVTPKRIGLDVWMARVPELADRVRDGWGADDVHDLRVALRRCRTMADALAEVNPGPGWRKMKKASRDLFDALGELRDAQVEREWVKRLSAASDPVRKHMLRVLARQEKKRRTDAERALEKFDRKDWRKWSRKLPAKAQFFPVESIVFQRQALTKLNDAVELYQLARKSRSRVAWHRLRIGIKHFRYIVENFLPQRYEVWAGDLKRMQDLLGDVHDLDVLRAEIRRNSSTLDPAVVANWFEKIESERKTRLAEFRAKAADKESLWLVWRAGFQWGHSLRAVDSADRQIA
jgi:CHAD domain-containing protein